MKRCSITLIATRHGERGQCTSDVLYNIIEQIAPDVIFEEVPAGKFDAVYKGLLRESLEIHTIKRYLEKYHIVHVPVDADLDEVTANFSKSDYSAMVSIFLHHSPEYRSLVKQRQIHSEVNGFAYLNSDEWTMLSKHMDMLEAEIIKSINHPKLNQRYKDWLNVLDIRNNEMISNIYKYVETNKCERGLLLVGVEHRRQIIEKIPQFDNTANLKVDWNFNYFNSGY